MSRLRVGIIGLGRMACGYDRPEGEVIQTHVKACLAHPGLELAVISDRDLVQAAKVKSTWDLAASIVHPDEFPGSELDIVCISSPRETHLPLLVQLSAAPPRLIFCEKPLAQSVADAREAVARLDRGGCMLAVNYLRRWIPGLAGWLREARAGALGALLMANATYSGGFWNNASHALDILAAALGDAAGDIRLAAPPIHDRGSEDPTLTLTFTLGGACVRLHGVDGRIATVFEVDMLFEKARIRVWDCGGIRAQMDRLQPIEIDGYAPELVPTEHFLDAPPRLMAHVWANLADHLSHNLRLAVDVHDTLGGIALQGRLATFNHNPSV